eukprot:TRINITY_DN5344_c0_g1_i1.p1 TRINITY_DN5344_c0_g1~~TRINITY_DN5344_c0_g1_i1.p1  ORF type:complete len:216 (+),score=19.25 TRINITY_DN5344_c0_g1_i1:41-688(+)
MSTHVRGMDGRTLHAAASVGHVRCTNSEETAALTSIQQGQSTPQGADVRIVIVGGNLLLQSSNARLTKLRSYRSASQTSSVTPSHELEYGFKVEKQTLKGGPCEHIPCISRVRSIPMPEPSTISSRDLKGAVQQETGSTAAYPRREVVLQFMALQEKFANIEERLERLEKRRGMVGLRNGVSGYGLPGLESQRVISTCFSYSPMDLRIRSMTAGP